MFMRAVLLLLVGSVSALQAADWPGWRGPRGDGTTPETQFPTKWNPSENIKWKTVIPGEGHSSPCIANGKIFVTSCLIDTLERKLYCVDQKTGQILWERTCCKSPLERKHKLNSYASSTPCSDGERVYVTFYQQPNLMVYCYSFTGELVWSRSPGEFHSVHGFCSSPVLFEDKVIVNADQDPKPGGPAYIVALNKLTGEEKYRIDRPNRLRSYCPPVILTVGGRTQMVLTGSKCVASYNPANGERYWLVNGPTEQFVSSVVYHAGLVFLTAGFPERWVMAIDPTGDGNVTKTHVKWSKKNDGGYVPSPVAHDGMAFVVTDEGVASCWDLKTGKLHWKERLGGHHSGSGVLAGGLVYFTDDDGVTFVLKASSQFDLVSKNPLGEKCYSSPAFAEGEIFLRGEKLLFCIK